MYTKGLKCRVGLAMTVFSLLLTVDLSSAGKSKVIQLTSDTWRQTLEGEWMIKFYAPWCPACKSMEEDYKKFAEWSDGLNVNIAEVNINKEPGLSGRFIVTALPSIYHAKNGVFHRYTGARDSNTLHSYIEDGRWRMTEPVSWYRHPDSILMTMMAGLFHTSVFMKNFHETLTETYGFSTVMAYVIFGVVTVITGLVLGLVMVFIIDCIAPPKKRQVPPIPETPIPEEGEEQSEEEEEKVDDEGGSTSQESASEKEEEEVVKRKSSQGDSSEGEGRNSRASSKSSATSSQEWEQVQGPDADGAEKVLSMEKALPDEPVEGQELRKRATAKPAEDDPKED